MRGMAERKGTRRRRASEEAEGGDGWDGSLAVPAEEAVAVAAGGCRFKDGAAVTMGARMFGAAGMFAAAGGGGAR